MAVVFAPTTRFKNKTKDSMVLTMKDDDFELSRKRIKSEGSVNLYYRKGFGRNGSKISFWVLPENPAVLDPENPEVLSAENRAVLSADNRAVLEAHPNPILPAHLFNFAEIEISYKLNGSVTDNYRAGAAMHFHFKRGRTIRRIGLVRYVAELYDSVKTPFGNCCFAAHVPSEGDAAGHASAPTNQAPGRLAPAPASDVRIDIPSADQVAAPTPPSEIELVTNNSHVPNLGVTAGHASGLGVAPDPDPAPLVVGDAPGPVTAPIQAPPALEGAPGPDHIEAPPALGEGPSSASAPGPSTSLSLGEALGEAPDLASATEPSISLNMVEALGQASPALEEASSQALYPTEAITPAPALHVGVDIPSAAQVAAPATPSEILVTY